MKNQITKFSHLKITLLLVLLVFCGCGGEDETVMPIQDDPVSIDVKRAETTQILTNGGLKTWRISNAQLDASGTIIDLSDNFNVVDDEFIFSGTATNGSLIWRPGNAINLEATTEQESLLDYYLEPINSVTTFDEESATALKALDGAFSFEVNEDGTISGTMLTSGRQITGTLNVVLTPKTNADYNTAPSNGLDFTFVTSIMDESTFTGETPVGMIGSYSDNSLFLASRNESSEQILKYDLTNNNWSSSQYPQNQLAKF